MGKACFSLVATTTLAFLVLHIFPIAPATAQKSSPTSSLPPGLRDRLSPLTTRQVDYYGKLIKRGAANAMTEDMLYEFCESARLLCGESSTDLPTSSKDSSARLFRKWLTVKKGASSHESAQAGVAIGSDAASSTNLPTSEDSLADRSVGLDAFVGWIPPSTSTPSRIGSDVASSSNLPTSEDSLPDRSVGLDAFRGWIPPSTSAPSRIGSMQQHQTTSMGAYFREKDLLVGAQLVLPTYLHSDGDDLSKRPSFLPASLALSLPRFDLHHLSDLLKLFHIPSHSRMAQQVQKVLDDCDRMQKLGKDDNFMINFCATSFEAMLEFASSILEAPSNMIQALTNSKIVGKPGSQVTIVRVAQLAATHDAVDCHDLTFPFKVMGCHRIKDSKAFTVRLASEESLTMDLLVACHKNTTLFNPLHEAFFQLKSSPGHTDICHWLPNNDNMWIPL